VKIQIPGAYSVKWVYQSRYKQPGKVNNKEVGTLVTVRAITLVLNFRPAAGWDIM
jgi:hypothetical protein